MTISPDKTKAVDAAMGQIERQFGKGAIMKLGARPVENIPVISTGSIELDREPHRKSGFAAGPQGPSSPDAAMAQPSPATDTQKES